MCNILLKLKKDLPFEDSQQGRNKRLAIWQKWDCSSFGFLSLSDIKLQLSDLLDLVGNQNLKLVINLAYKRVTQLANQQSKYKGEYLERRFFRVFVECFTHLFQKMLLFEHFDSNKDNRINEQEFRGAEKVLERWKIGWRGSEKVKMIGNEAEITLEGFIERVTNVTESRVCNII